MALQDRSGLKVKTGWKIRSCRCLDLRGVRAYVCGGCSQKALGARCARRRLANRDGQVPEAREAEELMQTRWRSSAIGIDDIDGRVKDVQGGSHACRKKPDDVIPPSTVAVIQRCPYRTSPVR
jgi:hypothetical protein